MGLGYVIVWMCHKEWRDAAHSQGATESVAHVMNECELLGQEVQWKKLSFFILSY